MMTNSKRMAAIFVAALTLAGCPETESETTDLRPTTSATSGPSSHATTTPTAAPSAEKLAVVPRAKSELHEKDPDASHSGTALSAAGSTWSFTVPKAWKTSSADGVERATAEDDKSRFGVVSFSDDDDTKANDVLKALALTECTWADAEAISLGTSKVATQVSDGVCMRGKTVVRTIVAVVGGDAKLVAIGGWDDAGGDDTGVFNSFRSLAEPKSVAACCAALTNNAIHAPANQKLIYAGAVAVCQTLTQSKDWRQALAQRRVELTGVSIPAACL